MFEFLTKSGRAKIAEAKRIRLQHEQEQTILRERKEYEQNLAAYSKFMQAYYWFDESSLSKYHLYASEEIPDLDVYYLGQMIEAIDEGVEDNDLSTLSLLTRKTPIQLFASKFSKFMMLMLDILCDYAEIDIAFEGTNDREIREKTRQKYASINPEYIEYILTWAIDHNVIKARMYLYEYLKWRGKTIEADQVKSDAEKARQTPWFWTSFNHYQPVVTDTDDSKKFALVHTGNDFEAFIKWKLETVNIICDRTGGSGDQGVDILVYGNPKVAIQCKFYTHAIDNSAVQQVYAGMHYYDCEKALVVSNANFTYGAQQLAKKLGVTLCHYKTILKELKEYGCVDDHDDMDEMTAMGTFRGIRETLLRHPGLQV